VIPTPTAVPAASMQNPTWIAWSCICIWILLPIFLAFVAYRLQVRYASKNLEIRNTKEKEAGKIINIWTFSMDEKTLPDPTTKEDERD
jgi:hypothetical protein